MKDQVTDLRSTVAALRRDRGVLAAAAVVGLALGATYAIVQPPVLTSTALVLLPTPTLAASSDTDVNTQVRIALSATVLEQAGKAVEPALSARTVERMLDVSAPTNQLMEIDARSTSAPVAQTLAQAVAESYVNYVGETASAATSAALADLNTRVEDLQKQITDMQDEITATTRRQQAVDPDSSSGRREAQLLAGLETEQGDLSLQLDKVKDQIATSTPAGSAAITGTVIQKATPATGFSTWQRLLIWAPVGAVICTAMAVAILLATARRDPRVRLRDEIADAVGSPVLAAVRSRPQRSVAGWSALLATYEATPVESWAFRQVLRGLVSADRKGEPRGAGKVDHPQSLTVVSLSGDGRGVAIGPQLAAFTSSLGVVTRLVTQLGNVRAPTLWAAAAADRASTPRPSLFVGDVPDGVAIDLTISLVVVDRTQPDLGDALSTAATLLTVAAASATEQELARVAVAVDDAGRRIDGIVVADPDRTDWTSGRHTMDERVRRMPLPVRLTGVGSSDVTTTDPNRTRA
jgi:phosphoribosylformylglycinamidine (FGAM) synthase PurS component